MAHAANQIRHKATKKPWKWRMGSAILMIAWLIANQAYAYDVVECLKVQQMELEQNKKVKDIMAEVSQVEGRYEGASAVSNCLKGTMNGPEKDEIKMAASLVCLAGCTMTDNAKECVNLQEYFIDKTKEISKEKIFLSKIIAAKSEVCSGSNY